MNYSTTVDFPSRLIPGLIYSLRKMNARRRAEFKINNAKILADLRDLAREIEPLQTEAKDAEDAAKLEPCTCADGHEHKPIEVPEEKPKDTSLRCAVVGCECRFPRYRDGLLVELQTAYEKYREYRSGYYYTALIEWAVSAASGKDENGDPITIDGQPLTSKNLTLLPDESTDELGDKIDSLFGLSFEEQLGFKSPGTSNAPEAGPISSSSAETAN